MFPSFIWPQADIKDNTGNKKLSLEQCIGINNRGEGLQHDLSASLQRL
jgi:hypothetical protein